MTHFCSSPGSLFQQSPPEFSTNMQALGSITLLTVLLAGNVQVLMLAKKRPASRVLQHSHHLCPHFLTHTSLFWLIPLPTRHQVPPHQGLSLTSKGWEVLFPTCMLPYCPLPCPSTPYGCVRSMVAVFHHLRFLLTVSFALSFPLWNKIFIRSRFFRALLSFILGAEV